MMELLKIYHEHFMTRELRVDGRKFNESRDLLINLNSVSSADSSVTVKLGSTTVICGMKVVINSEAFKTLETVGYGDLINLKVSLHSLDGGDEGGERDEITSLIVKTIKETILFDHKPLISEDEDGTKQYLTLDIEFICLNNDGNVFDAFIIAFLAAINTLEFPDYKDVWEEQMNQSSASSSSSTRPLTEKIHEKRHLNLLKFPISVTSVLIKDSILVDPNRDEEQLSTGCISVVFDVNSGKIIILEKKGGKSMDENNLIKHLTFTKTIADKFYKTLPFLSRKGDEMET